ncbi:murein biosynthesis integral membrane protein MurJ [Kozakia baliensis]|uniref:Probable lipid II flippase MurJ n=1 Tax=Kozakia baliensis TaxID=153496 RepID=A0A1D8URX5_9PROT|nr:murein biosynthesis integral membrane protein MurJ [Kozakia baliensis]AOX16366.1 lipid II flippase MurJ [Kozakia baliensis]GBR28751.1 integral membrane protein MviN [Kozakia baliensis NRIC 0488]GEL63564.1 putative lipid II flippase MurJ [Kozakia baliensis]
MLKNFLTVGGWTMLSRVLGLIRDQLLAAYLGAGAAQDAYQVAFRLPNMFRRLFGEGAFNAAFVPLFTERLTRDGEAPARAFASEALSCLSAWLLAITIFGEVFMPWVISFIAPGFGHEGGRFELAVSLTRITFPYLILICAAALVAGVLNGLHRFSMAAGAYVSFNIVGIISVLLGAYLFHDTVHVTAWGITLSGFVQFGLLFWSVRRAGMPLKLVRPRLTPDMRAMLRRLGPGLIGSGVTQLNLTVDTMIATLLPAGSISWLYFADRVNQLPLGVLGAAAGTTLLPVLTRHAANREVREGHATMNRAIDYALLLTLPACFGLLALAPEIMSTLFGYGRFTTQDALFSAQSLRAYALGLPAFVLIKVLSPGFFAHGDTKTPVRIGFFTLALNLALNLSLYRPLAHVGPPLASALAAIVNMMLLGVILYRRDVFHPDKRLIDRLVRMTAASALMAAAVLMVARTVTPGLILWHGLARAAALGALMIVAGFIYLAALSILGVATPRTVLGKLRRR